MGSGRIAAVLHMALGVFALACAVMASAASAISTADFLASLSEGEVNAFQEWKAARGDYEKHLDAYWDQVDAKRQARKPKRAARLAFDGNDYVMSFPPTYKGPKLGADLAKKYEKFVDDQQKSQPTPPKELPTVADYLDAAKRVYNFIPERVSEKEFKRRYAEEALALGLTKEQVVRVYALETGGIGTYDMQSGIHPIKKTGRAISSAIGYAQLLDANSVDELAQHGNQFVERVDEKLRNPNLTAPRRAALKAKLKALKHMIANVKHVPKNWEADQVYAKTPQGMGMHTLNLDGDIGPILQANKLKGLKDTAEKFGRPTLAGHEMEAMNLAGPVTGIEMMLPVGQKAPVTNFFARRAYYVNKMVVGLTGEQLLAELDRRMTESVREAGAIEFATAFDSVAAAKTAGR